MKAGSNLVSGKYWQLLIWGEVPPGVSDEDMSVAVHHAISTSIALTPNVKQSMFQVTTSPPPQQGVDDVSGGPFGLHK